MSISPLLKLLDLSGRHAVVTGGAMGIGAEVAMLLAQQGAAVTILDRDEAGAKRRAEEIAKRQLPAVGLSCDVSQQTQVEQAISAAREQHGSISILANCAGVTSAPGMPYTRSTEEDFDRTMAINVKGIFNTAKACHDDLIASTAGRVVNLSSITGVISAAYMPVYSVSKAAVISLTKVLARDLAPHQVTANAICPGFLWTPMWDDLSKVMARDQNSADPEADGPKIFEQRIKSHVPMGRPQTTIDIAALVAFLCADAAANVTGQVIGVDGGVTI